MCCPVCKKKESYCDEMLRMGIAIPDRQALLLKDVELIANVSRDAEWEVSGDYATEDFEYCSAELCTCPHGRSYSTQIG